MHVLFVAFVEKLNRSTTFTCGKSLRRIYCRAMFALLVYRALDFQGQDDVF